MKLNIGQRWIANFTGKNCNINCSLIIEIIATYKTIVETNIIKIIWTNDLNDMLDDNKTYCSSQFNSDTSDDFWKLIYLPGQDKLSE